MRCDQVMKRLVHFVSPADSLRAAAQMMRDKDVGFLVVCDHEDAVIGVITDRDIVLRAAADDRAMSATRVETAMSPDVITVRPAQDVADAEALMRDQHKSRMVVTDDDGTLRGVLSLSDIAQYET